MLFTPANRDDIKRYYTGTYVKFKEHGDMLFQIKDVGYDKVTGILEDGRPFSLYMSDEFPYEVGYVLPHKSYFQYKGDAMLLERIPAKQYYRGLREDNTQVGYIRNGGVVFAGLSFELLKAFVTKQQFYTLSGAINAKNFKSCVLNSRMMYNRSTKQIYVDFIPVAFVTEGIINMTRPIFREEVEAYILSTGEKWEIK